jgi:hypothetical protein
VWYGYGPQARTRFHKAFSHELLDGSSCCFGADVVLGAKLGCARELVSRGVLF